MFRRFIVIGVVSLFVLIGYAPGQNYIFRTKLSGTALQAFSTAWFIDGFTVTDSIDGWVYLKALASDGTSGYILRSRISGTALQDFLPSAYITRFTTEDSSDGWVYLMAHTESDSGYILRSKLSGTAGQGYACGSGSAIKEFTVKDSIDGWVYLGVVSGIVGIEEEKETEVLSEPMLVTGFKGIAPNPCDRSQLALSYTIGTDGFSSSLPFATQPSVHVILSIYDATGRLVTTLVNESQKPGRYRLSWSASDNTGRRLSSGVYFFRFKAGKFVKVRKLILIK